MTAPQTSSRSPPNAQYRRALVALISVLTAVSAVVFALWILERRQAKQEANHDRREANRNLRLQRDLGLRREIRRLYASAENDNRQCIATAKARVAELTRDPQWRSGVVEETAKELKSLGLVWQDGKDKAMGTAKADERRREVVDRRLSKPCQRTGKLVAAEVANLNTRLAERHTQLQADLLQAREHAYAEPAPGQAGRQLAKDLAQPTELARTRAKALCNGGIKANAAVVDASFVAKTVIKRVAARLAVRAGAALPLPALDGPLPVGEFAFLVLNGVFAAQAADDLYEALRHIPDQMRAGLNDAVRNYFANLNAQATKVIGELQTEYEQCNRQLANDTILQLAKDAKGYTP